MRILFFCIIVLSAILQFTTADSTNTSNINPYNTISMSGDVASGLLIGVGLVGLLTFSVGMLTSIETSDTLAQPKRD